MRRFHVSLVFPLILAVAVAGCDSSTDVSEVEATGRWESAGALRVALDTDVRLVLTETSGGSVSGTWHMGGAVAQVMGTNQNGNLQLTLASFQGTNATFEGRFTDRYRMAGTINGVALDGEAVFRRTSFTTSN